MSLKSVFTAIVFFAYSFTAHADNRSCWTDSFAEVQLNIQKQIASGDKVRLRFQDGIDFQNPISGNLMNYGTILRDSRPSSIGWKRNGNALKKLPKGSYEILSIGRDSILLKNGVHISFPSVNTGAEFFNQLYAVGVHVSGAFKHATQCGVESLNNSAKAATNSSVQESASKNVAEQNRSNASQGGGSENVKGTAYILQ